jgi:hypothetical protein
MLLGEYLINFTTNSFHPKYITTENTNWFDAFLILCYILICVVMMLYRQLIRYEPVRKLYKLFTILLLCLSVMVLQFIDWRYTILSLIVLTIILDVINNYITEAIFFIVGYIVLMEVGLRYFIDCIGYIEDSNTTFIKITFIKPLNQFETLFAYFSHYRDIYRMTVVNRKVISITGPNGIIPMNQVQIQYYS